MSPPNQRARTRRLSPSDGWAERRERRVLARNAARRSPKRPRLADGQNRLGDEDCLFDQSDLVGLTNLQYPFKINEFDFNFSRCLASCFAFSEKAVVVKKIPWAMWLPMAPRKRCISSDDTLRPEPSNFFA